MKLYFTFGSDPRFPYGREDYVVVVGSTVEDCAKTFKAKYPNRDVCGTHESVLNCADYYTEAEWAKSVSSLYAGRQPIDILFSDRAYGEATGGFDPFWAWIPAKSALMFVQPSEELSTEDEEAGYVDSIDYTVFDVDAGSVTEDDGGILLLTQSLLTKYKNLAGAIPDLLDTQYGDRLLEAQILKKEKC